MVSSLPGRGGRNSTGEPDPARAWVLRAGSRHRLGDHLSQTILRGFGHFDREAHRARPIPQPFRKLADQSFVAAKGKLPHARAQIGRDLFVRDAQLARQRASVDDFFSCLRFDHRLARAKGHNPASRRDHKRRAMGFRRYGDPAVPIRRDHAGQRGQTQRETHRLQSGRLGHRSQLLQLLLAHRELSHIGRRRRTVGGTCNLQLAQITGEPLFGLDLQQAVLVLRRELRQGRMLAHHPAGRNRDHAGAFADPGGIEMIGDFAAHQLGFRLQQIQREGGGRGLDDLQFSLGARHQHRAELTVGERKPQDRLRPFF